MDLYDSQTLGIMVFGGFMVISALCIVLVSTFSMKETSYEEALAKQRRELGKMAPPGQLTKKDKKKEKASEKKNCGKKKENQPNGKLAELEPEDVPVAEPELAPEPVAASAHAPEPAPTPAPKPTPAPTALEASLAQAPKKKEKKMAKVEPALAAPAPMAPSKSAPAPMAPSKPAPAPMAPSKPAPAPMAPSKPAPAPMAPSKPAPAPMAPSKPAPAPAPMAPSKPVPASMAHSKPAPAPMAHSKPAPAPMAHSKPAPVLEANTKEVPVMAVPPVGSQRTAAKAQETKTQDPYKKKASSKKKAESVVDSGLDSPLYLPYKALVSTVSSMVFSQGEAQCLLEILSDKAGIKQETWHMASQKADLVAVMKKHLATQQEDATAAKNRLRELSRELSVEKSKVASVETRLSSQLSSREQEMIALQARMQASYQDHIALTQKLNSKVLSLQEQLESGPTAQLARLQQENSILRDALNQATSQAESKQNAELAKLRQDWAKLRQDWAKLRQDWAKLRQDWAKLTKELGEKRVSLQADENIKSGLEAKVSSVEKQLSLLQASHAESEQVLQRRLEEVSEELRSSQSTLEKAKQDATTLSDLQVHLGSVEADLKERSVQVEALTAQLEQMELEKGQLEDQVGSINVLLEASQNRDKNKDVEDNATGLERLQISLQDRHVQLALHQEEPKQLKDTTITAEVTTAETKLAPNSEDRSLVASLQEELKHLKEEMERLLHSPVAPPSSIELKSADVSGETEQLLNSLEKSESQEASLEEDASEQAQSSATQSDNTAELAVLQTSLAERDAMMTSLQEELREARDQSQKVQETLAQVQQSKEFQLITELPELLEKLKEAEDSHGTLQAECDQYRTVLAETEGMLKDLQKSVEEEERVWKSKMADSEDQLKKVRGQLSEAMECAQRQKAFPEAGAQNCQSEPEAQKTVVELQAQLDMLTEAGGSPQAGTEDGTQLKLRLQKEGKLTKDLGQAATKLQQLLKVTQERDNALQAKEESTGLKEGTSV